MDGRAVDGGGFAAAVVIAVLVLAFSEWRMRRMAAWIPPTRCADAR